MNFLDNIKDETLIICTNKEKDVFIRNNKIHKYKCMTFNEFIKKFFFDYDESAIIYLMDKLKIKYEIAKTYLDNLYYIDKLDYKSKKLNFLKEIKEDLDNNNLLIYNKTFTEYLKTIKIIFYSVDLDEFYKEKFKYLDYQIINEEVKDYKHKIIKFATINEEIEYVAYKISELIYNKIDIKRIKLTNISSDYYQDIERIFGLYNLKVNIPYNRPLSSFKYIKEFIKNLKEKDLNYAIDELDKNNPLYNELIKVINKYLKYNNIDLIIKKLDYEYIENTKYKNAIQIIDYLDYIPNDLDYVFMLNFNDGEIPKSYKDIDYITDNIKDEVKLMPTSEKNILLRTRIINKIKSIKNLTITYKEKDLSGTCYISTLENYFEVSSDIIPNNISYSEKYNQIKLASKIDKLIKFNEKSDDFNIYINNYNIKYNSFDNKYHKINKKIDKLTLSYTKIKDYYECSFKYYLANVLKLDIYEETFSIILGNMVHYVLENTLKNKDYDPIKYANEFIKDYTFTSKEQFFINKYISYLKGILDHILNEKEYIELKESMYEKQVSIPLEDNINFMGKIDKILYQEINNETYLALIDYKTGNDEISLKYLKEGLNLQLPIYLYLSKFLGLNKITYCGFYLQKINIKDEDYRYEGYTNSNKEITKYIDNNYDNSKIIKGLSTNKDGSFKSYSKVLNNEEIDKIICITEDLINKALDNIKNNEFNINPKKTESDIIGCKYCKYKDICFVKNKDYVEIKETSMEEL